VRCSRGSVPGTEAWSQSYSPRHHVGKAPNIREQPTGWPVITWMAGMDLTGTGWNKREVTNSCNNNVFPWRISSAEALKSYGLGCRASFALHCDLAIDSSPSWTWGRRGLLVATNFNCRLMMVSKMAVDGSMVRGKAPKDPMNSQIQPTNGPACSRPALPCNSAGAQGFVAPALESHFRARFVPPAEDCWNQWNGTRAFTPLGIVARCSISRLPRPGRRWFSSFHALSEPGGVGAYNSNTGGF
jgi:hypothetical protein